MRQPFIAGKVEAWQDCGKPPVEEQNDDGVKQTSPSYLSVSRGVLVMSLTTYLSDHAN